MHAEDCALVTEVASFIHLLRSCQDGQSSLSAVTSHEGVDSDPGATVINFQLSSLFTKSTVCALTLSTFSEGNK